MGESPVRALQLAHSGRASGRNARVVALVTASPTCNCPVARQRTEPMEQGPVSPADYLC